MCAYLHVHVHVYYVYTLGYIGAAHYRNGHSFNGQHQCKHTNALETAVMRDT